MQVRLAAEPCFNRPKGQVDVIGKIKQLACLCWLSSTVALPVMVTAAVAAASVVARFGLDPAN
jgi:cation transporter-like permease